MQKLPDIDLEDETPHGDMRSLTRLGLWGGGAAAALLIVAVTTFTDAGQRRLALAFQGSNPQPQVVAVDEERRRSVRDAEIENRRLADQLRNLSEDRDRLLARMTVLERNYEDVTGSISKLNNPPKPPLPEIKPAAPAPAPVAAAPPPAPPEVAPVASVPAAPEKAVPPAQPAPPPAQAAVPVAQPAAPAQQAAAPEPVVEGAPARTEFGVDLGGAPSVASLRVAWDRIRRNHPVQLEGLRPVIGIRDGRTGQVELRLVVGPITNAAAAAKLCASLAATGLSCQPTTFDGQRLALR